jgi:hypothetical protein
MRATVISAAALAGIKGLGTGDSALAAAAELGRWAAWT